VIRYNPLDENYARRIVDVLKTDGRRLSSFYDLELNRNITILIPASPAEYHNQISGEIPRWSNAVFLKKYYQIIIKKPQWFGLEQSFEQTLLHEMSHAYFYRKFLTTTTPLWFEEGLAEYLAGEQIGMDEGVLIANALFSKNILTLKEIENLLSFSQAKARLAYLQSLTVVNYLQGFLQDQQISWPQFLNAVEREGFQKALQDLVRMDIIDFEIKWYQWLKAKYRWFILLNWENLIWIFIVVIFFGAMYAIRYRNRKILASWEEQEQQHQVSYDPGYYISENEDHLGRGM
jgi:hypothetical protein